jgi:chromosome segregation ATPase
MEPIRPDEDELRASRSNNTEKKEPQKPAKKATKSGNGGRSGPSTMLSLLVMLAVAGVGAFAWYQHSQRIQQLESQLEEADYWVRQSKLALARFEGELSETGEDLQEAGQSIEQRLSNQSARLDEADSEIRKLWGVANDRNKARLNEHEARLDSLNEALKAAAGQREALVADVNTLEETLSSEVDALETSIQQQATAQNQQLESQQSALKELQSALAGIKESVDSRLTRFQREQALTISGLESRISSLEVATQKLSGDSVASLKSDLANLKQTVSSIDASRAQLTSRLVRLSEEVSQLRARLPAQ